MAMHFSVRRLARWTATGLVVLLAIAACAIVVVETDWFKNWLRLQLVTRVATVLDGELRVGRLGGSLWRGVTLDDVELWNHGGRVVKVDHVSVRYDPFQFVHRRWVVDNVVLEHANVLVTETTDGWNVMRLAKQRTTTGAPLTMALKQIHLSDSTVTIAPLKTAKRELTAVDMDGSLEVARGVVAMTFASLRAYDEATGLTLREFSGTASDNFRAFNVRFAADSPAMKIAGVTQGEMTGTTRVLAGTIDVANLDLERLLGKPGFASNITGRVIARAALPISPAERGRLNFTFTGPRSTAFGYSADRIDATGDIIGNTVRFQSRVAGYSATANVNGTWKVATGAAPWTFDAHGTFAGVDVRRLPPNLKLPPLDSRVSGQFETSATPTAWRAHATLSNGIVEGATLLPGTEVSIDSAGGVISYAAVGEANHVDLQRVARVVPVAALDDAQFASDLSGNFFVAGQNSPSARPVVVGGALLHDSTMSGTTVPALNGFGYLSEGRLVVTAAGAFEGLNQATLALPSFPLAATGQADGWFAIADLDKPIDEDNLEGSVRLTLGASTIQDVPIKAAVVDGDLLDGLLTLRTLDVQHDEASVNASGSLGVHEPLSQEGISLVADIRDRAFLEHLLQRPIYAAGAVNATITGTTESPAATGNLTLHETGYSDSVSALTTSVKFTVDWPERNTDAMKWNVETDATFVKLGSTEIQRVAGTAIGGPRDMAINVTAEQKDRSLGVEGQLTLEPEYRELLMRKLAVTTQDVAWSLPDGKTAKMRYGSDRIDVSDLMLVRGQQQIAITGGFDLEPPAGGSGDREKLHIDLRDVELADINRALLGTRQLTGRINGSAVIDGTRQSPIVDGDIRIENGTVENVPFASAAAKGRYTGGIATVEAALEQSAGASLAASGTIPVAPPAGSNSAMDLKVSGGPVNLGLVQAFTNEVNNVVGDAALDVRVTGSLQDPILNGTVTLNNGAFEMAATGVRYQAIHAAINLADSKLDIRQFQVADMDGHLLTATGGLDVHRGITNRAFDIQVKSDNFAALNNQFGTAHMDVDLRVSGDISAPVIKGNLRLQSGRLEVSQILEKTTANPYSTEAQPEPGAAPASSNPKPTPQTMLDRADVALHVRLPDNLVLRGRNMRLAGRGFGIGDMNIITGGDFDVTKAPGAPLDVRGSLEVVRGTYSFQGRRFDIERGSDVKFRGGNIADPLINVNATRDVSGITAEVRLRGSAQSPELTLSSRPPLEEGDILSLIVFNQPINTLGSAEQANLGQRAASLAAGAIASPLADSIGQALNLDVFEIQAPTSETGTGSVVIGSQIGTRVLVGLRQDFGHDEASVLTLEYRVSRLLRFVTSVASGTLQAHATRRMDRGGVDLIFLIRY